MLIPMPILPAAGYNIADSSNLNIVMLQKGPHIIGAHASDLIHEIALAMEKDLTVKDIAHTIHSHPTLAEGIMEAAEDVHDAAIHAPKK